ncbi:MULTISPECIES: transposase [unclassified Streptomyces]|uniref:transposase n=1 Tax=unclassified Streptomyces TaxID=2593676 RepID=UPI002E3095F5|nr:transposase [Streptomyces sp. NBC_01358]
MADVEWAAVRPLLPAPAWFEGRGEQPEGYCHRQMLDAICYLVAGWRAMPADFPAWGRVHAFFRRWREHGLVAQFHDRLRGGGFVSATGRWSLRWGSSTRGRCGPRPR